MANKQISMWDGLFYLMFKNTKIADENDVMHVVTDVQVDFVGERFTITYDNGDIRNAGFKDILLMDVDGVTIEQTHSGNESQNKPTRSRHKHRKRKP